MRTPEDALFGAVKSDRSCGDCTACCVFTRIDTPELTKPAGIACAHCTGSGCAIYDSRPPVCRTFECGYKRIPGMPVEARPDKSGVLLTAERESPAATVFENIYYMVATDRDPVLMDSVEANNILAFLCGGPLPVYVYWNGFKTLVHPAGSLAEAIVEAAPGPAEQWLRAYAPYARAIWGPRANLPPGF